MSSWIKDERGLDPALRFYVRTSNQVFYAIFDRLSINQNTALHYDSLLVHFAENNIMYFTLEMPSAVFLIFGCSALVASVTSIMSPCLLRASGFSSASTLGA